MVLLLLLVMFAMPAVVAAQTTCCEGDGTATRPFLISNAAELADLAAKINNEQTVSTFNSKYYRLEADINLSANWIPIGRDADNGGYYPFEGFFDGNGKKITGLKITSSGDNLGLFKAIRDGEVKNLSLENVNISGGSFLGGITGSVNNAKISGCSVTGTIAGKNNIGGLAGFMRKGVVANSYAAGYVTGSSYLGGIAGATDSSSSIAGCYATNTIIGLASGSGNQLAVVGAGGIAGFIENSAISQSTALNCAIFHNGDLGTGFGRITGWNEQSALSDNIAFDAMRVAVNLGDPDPTKDQTTVLKTTEELLAMYDKNKFPGFDSDADMATHLSCGNVTPIRQAQVATGSIIAKAIGKTIALENVPSGAKVEIYNIKGKLVAAQPTSPYGHSSREENYHQVNPQIMRIMVQTGVYVVKVGNQNMRIVVK